MNVFGESDEAAFIEKAEDQATSNIWSTALKVTGVTLGTLVVVACLTIGIYSLFAIVNTRNRVNDIEDDIDHASDLLAPLLDVGLRATQDPNEPFIPAASLGQQQQKDASMSLAELLDEALDPPDCFECNDGVLQTTAIYSTGDVTIDETLAVEFIDVGGSAVSCAGSLELPNPRATITGGLVLDCVRITGSLSAANTSANTFPIPLFDVIETTLEHRDIINQIIDGTINIGNNAILQCCINNTDTASIVAIQSDVADNAACCANNTLDISTLNTTQGIIQDSIVNITNDIVVLETNQINQQNEIDNNTACCSNTTDSVVVLETNQNIQQTEINNNTACCLTNSVCCISNTNKIADIEDTLDGFGDPNAYSMVTADYVQPIPGNLVNVTVNETDWTTEGHYVYVEGAGYYLVVTVVSPTVLELNNLDYTGIVAGGTLIVAPRLIIAGGIRGPAGVNAFTTTLLDYNQPVIGVPETISVANTLWMQSGSTIFVGSGGGYYTVQAIVSDIQVTVVGLNTPSNAVAGTLIGTGAGVGPSGLPGTNGINGADGADGADGANGADGLDGADGTNSFTFLDMPPSGFTQQDDSSVVTITVQDSSWVATGQVIFIENGGYYLVDNVPSTTTIDVINQQYDDATFPMPTANVLNGGKISPGGLIGATGANGADGINGIDGINAFTQLNMPPSGFTQQDDSTVVTITVFESDWASIGQIIFIEGGGYYFVDDVPSSVTIDIINQQYDDTTFPIPTANVPNGGKIGPSGLKGTTGATGATGASGVDGADGANGSDGADGVNAFTQLNMPPTGFTQQDDSTVVTITVVESNWASIGQIIFIEGGGYYLVDSVPTPTTVDIINQQYDDTTFPIPTANVPDGGNISPGGLKGPTGANGANGADGMDGINAFTTLNMPPTGFTQQDESTVVTITVVDSTWAGVGQIIFIEGGGYYLVNAVPSGTTVDITNQQYDDTAFPIPTANVPDGGKISPGGIKGLTGTTGATGATGANGADGTDGADGTNGADGADGSDAFTQTSSAVTVLASGLPMTVNVDDSDWVVPGQTIFIENGGYFLVASKTPTSITFTNPEYPSNAGAGTLLASPKGVTAGGPEGSSTGLALDILDNLVVGDAASHTVDIVGPVSASSERNIIGGQSHTLSNNVDDSVIAGDGVTIDVTGLRSVISGNDIHFDQVTDSTINGNTVVGLADCAAVGFGGTNGGNVFQSFVGGINMCLGDVSQSLVIGDVLYTADTASITNSIVNAAASNFDSNILTSLIVGRSHDYSDTRVTGSIIGGINTVATDSQVLSSIILTRDLVLSSTTEIIESAIFGDDHTPNAPIRESIIGGGDYTNNDDVQYSLVVGENLVTDEVIWSIVGGSASSFSDPIVSSIICMQRGSSLDNIEYSVVSGFRNDFTGLVLRSAIFGSAHDIGDISTSLVHGDSFQITDIDSTFVSGQNHVLEAGLEQSAVIGFGTTISNSAGRVLNSLFSGVGHNFNTGGNTYRGLTIMGEGHSGSILDGITVLGSFASVAPTHAHNVIIANGQSTGQDPLLSGSNGIYARFAPTTSVGSPVVGGTLFIDGSVATTGADYAEVFEYADGNPLGEDRIGHFVALEYNATSDSAEKIYLPAGNAPKATIVGIVTATQSIVGDTASERWHGARLLDDYGRTQFQSSFKPPLYDLLRDYRLTFAKIANETTNNFDVLWDEDSETTTQHSLTELDEWIESVYTSDFDEVELIANATNRAYTLEMQIAIENLEQVDVVMLNPDWDDTRPYVPRLQRSSHDPIGMIGKIFLRHDGSCVSGSLCRCCSGSDAGVGTLDTSGNSEGYYVMKSVSANVAQVLVK